MRGANSCGSDGASGAVAKRIGRGALDESEREQSLRIARTLADYAIRLGVSGARERFREMRPEAEHAADHHDADLTQTLTTAELCEIAAAIGDGGPGYQIRRALDRAAE